MNFLSIVRGIAGMTGFGGILLMFSEISKSDYMDSIGVYYPISEMIPMLLVGLAMLVVGGGLCLLLED